MDRLVRPHPWYTVLPLTVILAFLLTLTGVWQLIFLAGVAGGLLLRHPRNALLLGLGSGLAAWSVPLAWLFAYFPTGEAAALFVRILGLPTSFAFLPVLLALLLAAATVGLGAALGGYVANLLREARAELERMEDAPRGEV